MDPMQLSSSERGSSGARSPVQAYVKNIKEDDDSLDLMRATEEAVNAMVHIQAQAQNEVVQEQDKKSNDDKFTSFGSWVGLQLRGLDVNAANNKMHLIATVLLTDASVVMNADDAHTSGDSLDLMRATEEAVNAMVHIQAQAQNEVVQEQDKKSNDDKFSSFGSWVGLQLRGLDVNAANNKMHLIATVLLTDASVIMNADDAHTSGGEN
ncbi:hypothetical protein TELCIR_06183 [Teladorsagia circumcincta]|uniref:Uncharacterized protein n=1 Tax=Teladorsagia circumcincta TaxID=45464 RepID=A0A2G9UNP6_TELCI|nr:hypothetical protein TELCIR_06183 [Teladorsagia circumcincta]